MMVVESGHYAPLSVKHCFHPYPVWHIYVGTTPDGKWVAEYYSKARSGYQRRYFGTEAEALADVNEFSGAK